MVEKFNFDAHKWKNGLVYLNKYGNYAVHLTLKAIRSTLKEEAENYARRIHKIPDMFRVITYTAANGKIAVLELNTPKKRYLYRMAEAEACHGNMIPMKDFKEKYGFIPKPSNVLKKYIEYGYMTSQDVEHLYHCEPVDYKISDNLDEFISAYNFPMEDKDVIAPGFNGYSCMSQEPDVGRFYYYFGAYMLIFYEKENHDMVGRMVLWKWKDQLYYYKGYVKSRWQMEAANVVQKLESDGVIKRGLPPEFTTDINARLPGKSLSEAYDELCDVIRVPYIDEDLCLDSDKTTLTFFRCYDTKKTGCQLLEDYGVYRCEECGEEVDEGDLVTVGDYDYCQSCAKYCNHCEEWCHPDEDGAFVDGDWICQSCLDDDYYYCHECGEYHDTRDITEYYDKNGNRDDMCDECAEEYCSECDDCGELYINDALIEVDGKKYCPDCLKNHQKEA